jgi:hypothetical protein
MTAQEVVGTGTSYRLRQEDLPTELSAGVASFCLEAAA